MRSLPLKTGTSMGVTGARGDSLMTSRDAGGCGCGDGGGDR